MSAPTIGIVTAIPEEYVAVKALIDNQSRQFVAEDRSTYITGTLPSAASDDLHPVVVTMMSRAGNDIAATSCTNLLRSFPSVGVVVMCGIAAGIPNLTEPAKHVALGDIVVASWGIIDYDHVDETDGGVRLRPGFPRPSPLLINGANLLRAAELQGDRPWEQWLDPARRNLPAPYGRPAMPPGADVPDVHYGLIGSADRSLRSARVRDALAADYDVRALEMEGKGIGNSAFLNGLEWFVVRGVSDHGDHATNGTWRCHASLVAAAYTRALLAECVSLEPRGGHSKSSAGSGPPAGSGPSSLAIVESGVINQGTSYHLGDIRFEARPEGSQA